MPLSGPQFPHLYNGEMEEVLSAVQGSVSFVTWTQGQPSPALCLTPERGFESRVTSVSITPVIPSLSENGSSQDVVFSLAQCFSALQWALHLDIR